MIKYDLYKLIVLIEWSGIAKKSSEFCTEASSVYGHPSASTHRKKINHTQWELATSQTGALMLFINLWQLSTACSVPSACLLYDSMMCHRSYLKSDRIDSVELYWNLFGTRSIHSAPYNESMCILTSVTLSLLVTVGGTWTSASKPSNQIGAGWVEQSRTK